MSLDSPSVSKKYSREEYIYLSKLYERAERFEDMVKVIKSIIQLDPKLSKEERNILSASYKSMIADKRSSWILLNRMEKQESKKNNLNQVSHIKEIKFHIENELVTICNDIQQLIDKNLLANADNIESKVFYLKLKGDYYRYICEISKNDVQTFEDNAKKAEEAYRNAFDLANDKDNGLKYSNDGKIGLALNYAVFLYEVKGMKKEGCNLAKMTLNEAMKCLEYIEKNNKKDTLFLIQLIKENLIFWSSEMNEDIEEI